MSEQEKRKWIAAVLTNDETSTDADMVDYFMQEGGLSRLQAEQAVSHRGTYQAVGYSTYAGWC